jgi:transposase-like protein
VVEHSIDVLEWRRKRLEQESPDLLREMVQSVAEALTSAEADAICDAAYGERSPGRLNTRNGYRDREWDTRVGTIELGIPKLRSGSYFPDWLLVPRRRAEQALVSVVADCYLAGVSTRRVEKLVSQLGIDRMSKSQVSRLAGSLDGIVESFRTRRLDAGPRLAYLASEEWGAPWGNAFTFLGRSPVQSGVRRPTRTLEIGGSKPLSSITLVVVVMGAKRGCHLPAALGCSDGW